MGTFILPGRLKRELHEVVKILDGDVAYDSVSLHSPDNVLVKHADMIDNLVKEFGTKNSLEEAIKIITDYVNKTCEKILGCTAVFKNTEKGQAGMRRFLESIGYVHA